MFDELNKRDSVINNYHIIKKKVWQKENSQLIRSSSAEYLTFIASKGEGGVDAIYEDENIWLTKK